MPNQRLSCKEKKESERGKGVHRAYPEVNWSEWKCETTHNLYLLLDIAVLCANQCKQILHTILLCTHRRCEIPFWLHKICTIWWMFTCHGIAVAWRYITYTYFLPHPTNQPTHTLTHKLVQFTHLTVVNLVRSLTPFGVCFIVVSCANHYNIIQKLLLLPLPHRWKRRNSKR